MDRRRSIFKGLLAALGLLIFYFTVVTLISGRQFAEDQFLRFWYFILALSFGFGIQVGLYSYLRSASHQKVSPKIVATSGVSSTAAMISCCSHYLVNILPILGITGIVTLISQFQIQFFWVGLVFNFAGIAYMGSRVYRFSKET